MTVLTEICNEFRIPISYFFSDGIPEKLQLNEDEFREPFAFHGEYIANIPDKNIPEKRMPEKRIAEMLKVDKRTIYNVKKNGARASACLIVNVCNLTGISPMFFFGCEETFAGTYNDAAVELEKQKLENKIDQLEKATKLAESRLRHQTALLNM